MCCLADVAPHVTGEGGEALGTAYGTADAATCRVGPLSARVRRRRRAHHIGSLPVHGRHCWVVINLVITVVATLALLDELAPIGHLANAARAGTIAEAMRTEPFSLAVHSGGRLLTLLVPTVLSIDKPRGLTPCGHGLEAASTLGS